MLNKLCENCKENQAKEKHHMFSQTKWAKDIYGKKLLDDPRNIQWLCYDCHHCKPLKKLTELEFCQLLNIELRSKQYRR